MEPGRLIAGENMPVSLVNDIDEKRIQDTHRLFDPAFSEPVLQYFNFSGVEITIERCKNIISKSGRKLKDNDFYFEWLAEPSNGGLTRLIMEIDDRWSHLAAYTR